jgi:hypothetical protein
MGPKKKKPRIDTGTARREKYRIKQMIEASNTKPADELALREKSQVVK